MSNLDIWRGHFGVEYTNRQHGPNPSPLLRSILNPYWEEIEAVLEVGCNTGRNLEAFHGKHRVGVEPNAHARALTNKAYTCYDAHAGALPFADGTFDLVFTAGVLIHIGPQDLDRALYEIVRVSRRFILAVEYAADREEAVDYRGLERGIWKRPYGSVFMDRYPAQIVACGWQDELAGSAFDGCSWWLFDKRP